MRLGSEQAVADVVGDWGRGGWVEAGEDDHRHAVVKIHVELRVHAGCAAAVADDAVSARSCVFKPVAVFAVRVGAILTLKPVRQIWQDFRFCGRK